MMTTPAGGRLSHVHPAGQLLTPLSDDPPLELPFTRTRLRGVGSGVGDGEGSGVDGSAMTLTSTRSSALGGVKLRCTTNPSTAATSATRTSGATIDDRFTTPPRRT